MQKVRKTLEKDIPDVVLVYNSAKAYFRHNNIPQWQGSYPDEDTVRAGIREGNSYVLEEDGKIVGTVCLVEGEDPNYSMIENGQWLNEEPYLTIHRIALLPEAKGRNYAALFLEKAAELAEEKGIRNLRADTHELNSSMRRFMQKCGMTECGRIYKVKDHAPRISYQKVLYGSSRTLSSRASFLFSI